MSLPVTKPPYLSLSTPAELAAHEAQTTASLATDEHLKQQFSSHPVLTLPQDWPAWHASIKSFAAAHHVQGYFDIQAGVPYPTYPTPEEAQEYSIVRDYAINNATTGAGNHTGNHAAIENYVRATRSDINTVIRAMELTTHPLLWKCAFAGEAVSSTGQGLLMSLAQMSEDKGLWLMVLPPRAVGWFVLRAAIALVLGVGIVLVCPLLVPGIWVAQGVGVMRVKTTWEYAGVSGDGNVLGEGKIREGVPVVQDGRVDGSLVGADEQ